uniref:Lectin n=1 Tax=Cycas revoluta TaxID=3396 RepID=Q1ESY7_CYCRE|nr:lectin [Cycas revoluta]BAV72209.1 lectin [Cycas revoluta]
MAASSTKASVGYVVGGPWGGNGGDEWNDGTYQGIRKIVIRSGDVVDSLQIEYALKNVAGSVNVCALKHGGDGGKESTIVFDYPNETLTKIEGFYTNVITSLTFETNLKRYGPYGKAGGKHFESGPAGDGKIVGFYGRSGDYLDAIGVYAFTGVGKEGPYGGVGGAPWDDGPQFGISRILIHSGDVVDSIQVDHRPKHGGPGGAATEIQFNPDEVLKKIEGYFGPYYGRPSIIKSLTFHTNLTKYGPFGTAGGTQGDVHFASTSLEHGKIVGFFGRAAQYLDAIGVYIAFSA